jgi:hypothetical protein
LKQSAPGTSDKPSLRTAQTAAKQADSDEPPQQEESIFDFDHDAT